MKELADLTVREVVYLVRDTLASPGPVVPPGPPITKSLIYAGWFGNTTPTPSFVKDNLTFLESQPFDGMVVYLRDPAMTLNVSMAVMTSSPLAPSAVAAVLAPLVGLPWKRLTQNLGFVLGNTPPDFFDDWTVTIGNWKVLAKAAKDAGLKGICFDNEQYFAPWGNYSLSKYKATKTLAEYQTQARVRGAEVMRAVTSVFPDIVLLTLHGPYISEPSVPEYLGFRRLPGNELLGPFFVGFVEGAGASAKVIDGGELYTLRTPPEFKSSYDWREIDIASPEVNCAFIPQALRASWKSAVSSAFGVYDKPVLGVPMDPTILASTLANAIRQADQFVWFYAEASSFLIPPPTGASAAWVNAIRQARATAGLA
jgi:hypothetical protein